MHVSVAVNETEVTLIYCWKFASPFCLWFTYCQQQGVVHDIEFLQKIKIFRENIQEPHLITPGHKYKAVIGFKVIDVFEDSRLGIADFSLDCRPFEIVGVIFDVIV